MSVSQVPPHDWKRILGIFRPWDGTKMGILIYKQLRPKRRIVGTVVKIRMKENFSLLHGGWRACYTLKGNGSKGGKPVKGVSFMDWSECRDDGHQRIAILKTGMKNTKFKAYRYQRVWVLQVRKILPQAQDGYSSHPSTFSTFSLSLLWTFLTVQNKNQPLDYICCLLSRMPFFRYFL